MHSLAAMTVLTVAMLMPGSLAMDREQHRKRHIELHQAMDELIADYMRHHQEQRNFLGMPLEYLMIWSHRQTVCPDEDPELTQ